MLFIMGICALLSLLLLIWTVRHVVPVTNKFFGFIWQDPAEKERQAVLKRLKELHVDGNVPEEAAVLLASKEFNSTEQDLLDLLEMAKPSELKAVLTGRKSVLGVVASRIERSLRRRAK